MSSALAVIFITVICIVLLYGLWLRDVESWQWLYSLSLLAWASPRPTMSASTGAHDEIGLSDEDARSFDELVVEYHSKS